MAASPSYWCQRAMPRLALALLLAGCGSSDTPANKAGQAAPEPMAMATRSHPGSAATGTAYTAVVQQLYIAYFGRPADTGGLASFEARLAALAAPNSISGLDAQYRGNAGLRELIDSFGISAESAALYSGGTEAFVRAIYLNVLNRAADAEGLAYWSNAIDREGLTRGNASLAIMSGALSNQSAQGLQDGALITAKTALATAFTASLIAGAQADTYSGDAAAAKGRAMLSNTTASSTPASQLAQVNSTVAALAAPLGYSVSSLSGAYTYISYYNDSSKSNANAVLRFSVPSVPFSGTTSLNVAKKGFTSETGTVTFDGAGRFSATSTVNVDSAISTSATSGSYTVTPDGTLRLEDFIAGRIQPGGNIFVFAAAGGDPQIGIGIKQGGSFSNATLSGIYGMASYSNDPSVSNPVPALRFPTAGTITAIPFSDTMVIPIQKRGFMTDFGTATINGAGAFTFAFQTNVDGTVGTSSGAGSYAVSATGTVTIEGMRGGALADGSTVILANSSGDPQILVGMRAGTAMSAASLKGAYSIVKYHTNSTASPASVSVPYQITTLPRSLEFSVSIAKKGFTSELGTITFDGTGSYAASFSTNVDGALTTRSENGTYTVAADGTLRVGSGVFSNGRVQEGGRSFVFSAASGDPEMGFGIAKP